MKSKEAVLTIGQAAEDAGVNIQTLHYYERIGLLKPVSRKDSGYRVYNSDSVKRLRFIKRAQELGFPLDEIRELLSLRLTSRESRPRVRKKAAERLSAVRSKIQDLQKIEKTLSDLIRCCEDGESTGPCPILERLEGGK